MTFSGFDVDSKNKAGFDFDKAYRQGNRVAWIKFGGMNLEGNAPYRMNGYLDFVQQAWDAGFRQIGDYLVTGGSNPAGAARFWLAGRDPRVTFHVLDNEKLDYGRPWSDSEAATYFDAIGSEVDRWQYGSRDSLWEAHDWPDLQARAIKAHVAIYNGAPLQNCYPSTYPAALVKAHQYTDNADIGGLTQIDANAWTADAFTTITARRSDVTGFIYHIPGRYAKADIGDSQAAWIESTDSKIVAGWAKTLGASIEVTPAQFAALKKKHLTPLASATVNVDSAAVASAIDARVQDALANLDLTINGTIKKG